MFRATSMSLGRLSATSIIASRCLSVSSAMPNRSASVRIGCASGFWGDTPTAPHQLISKGNVDYLMFDYLSELTMSLLTAAQQKKSDLGYATDFVQYGVGPYLPEIKRKGIRVITNAGGINTASCVQTLKQAARKAGVELKIAQVTGDNMMPIYQDLLKEKKIKEMFTAQDLPPSIHSMTAYFGAAPIIKALEMGADIVVTGRTADSALGLAPLAYEFNWALDRDWDQLASGSLAGHLIECGGQATGGLFTDWESVEGYENLGFPVVEASASGDFLVTKPPETGGLLNKYTVGEQMLYEIGDPANYILPDVVCDFTQVKIIDTSDGVSVSGARGKPPTADYKVSATYHDGFKASAVAIVSGGRAAAKAKKTAEAIMKRAREILLVLDKGDFTRTNISIIGAEDTFGTSAKLEKGYSPREATLWMGVMHKDPEAIGIWGREIASAGTGMAPGLCGMVGGRPKATPCLKLFSFLYPKSKLPATVELDGNKATLDPIVPSSDHDPPLSQQSVDEEVPDGSRTFKLYELAYARSGDKGNACNIGIIARDPKYLPYIKKRVTEQTVYDYFRKLFGSKGKVTRYDVPGIDGINFVLEDVLDGGGIASLRPDPLGKSFAQMLLDFKIENVPDLMSDK